MLSDSIALLRNVVRSLLAGTAPGQLAAGFTIGMIIGVLPKSNLIALSLCVLLFSLRCNKGLGLVAAVAFSFVGHLDRPVCAQSRPAMLGARVAANNVRYDVATCRSVRGSDSTTPSSPARC